MVTLLKIKNYSFIFLYFYNFKLMCETLLTKTYWKKLIDAKPYLVIFSNIRQVSISIFQFKYFALFICFLSDDYFVINLFSNVLFQTFDYFWQNVSCCWFYCVDIFHIKLRFCGTLTVINFLTRILLIEALYKFRTIKCWLTLYLHMYGLG